jgi:hypothetical protein
MKTPASTAGEKTTAVKAWGHVAPNFGDLCDYQFSQASSFGGQVDAIVASEIVLPGPDCWLSPIAGSCPACGCGHTLLAPHWLNKILIIMIMMKRERRGVWQAIVI